jgi:hypothetical protein
MQLSVVFANDISISEKTKHDFSSATSKDKEEIILFSTFFLFAPTYASPFVLMSTLMSMLVSHASMHFFVFFFVVP